MDDINLFAKNLGIEFGRENCEKSETTEGIELPTQEILTTLGEKENYKY